MAIKKRRRPSFFDDFPEFDDVFSEDFDDLFRSVFENMREHDEIELPPGRKARKVGKRRGLPQPPTQGGKLAAVGFHRDVIMRDAEPGHAVVEQAQPCAHVEYRRMIAKLDEPLQVTHAG